MRRLGIGAPVMTLAGRGRCRRFCALLLLAGCAGGLSMAGREHAPYAASNAIMPVGFSETAIDPMHYRGEGQRHRQTPRERVEKIALARAAEIGVEQNASSTSRSRA